MRRLFAILLMLLVPLQFAWAATQGMHGHMDPGTSSHGFHTHDGDHDHHDDGVDSERAVIDEMVSGGIDDAHHEDGHHGGHYHPVFSSLLTEMDLRLGEAAPAKPPVHPPASFTSRVPPLFDWPPAARI